MHARGTTLTLAFGDYFGLVPQHGEKGAAICLNREHLVVVRHFWVAAVRGPEACFVCFRSWFEVLGPRDVRGSSEG